MTLTEVNGWPATGEPDRADVYRRAYEQACGELLSVKIDARHWRRLHAEAAAELERYKADTLRNSWNRGGLGVSPPRHEAPADEAEILSPNANEWPVDGYDDPAAAGADPGPVGREAVNA